MEIINFKTKTIKLLTKEQQESYENSKCCYICKDKFEDKHAKKVKPVNLVTIIQVNREVLHIAYVI